MVVGGVIGAVIFSSVISASAASPSPGTPATPGTFQPNESAAHEAGESAAQEAEDAGVTRGRRVGRVRRKAILEGRLSSRPSIRGVDRVGCPGGYGTVGRCPASS